MLAFLEARVNALTQQLNESAKIHNGLIGAYNEIVNLYRIAKETAKKVEPVVDAVAAVEPEIKPIADIVDTVAS